MQVTEWLHINKTVITITKHNKNNKITTKNNSTSYKINKILEISFMYIRFFKNKLFTDPIDLVANK